MSFLLQEMDAVALGSEHGDSASKRAQTKGKTHGQTGNQRSESAKKGHGRLEEMHWHSERLKNKFRLARTYLTHTAPNCQSGASRFVR
jgi:hypothetical protein